MLKNDNRLWVIKEIGDPGAARLEVLAQEFFRLIIPHQPETRLVLNGHTLVNYVLSEEAKGFRKLLDKENFKFENGTYTGLGQALLVSMFLQEVDLKNGNIGLDHLNRVIKIDGDCCFGSLTYDDGVYFLSAHSIKSLPCPKGYTVYNWLDFVQEKVACFDQQLIKPSLAKSPRFQNEVYQAILAICLLPDLFVQHFVDSYIYSCGEVLIDLICSRRDELRTSALQIKGFKEYLKTNEAMLQAEDIRKRLLAFRASGEEFVIDSETMNSLMKEYKLTREFLFKEQEEVLNTNKVQLSQSKLLLFTPPKIKIITPAGEVENKEVKKTFV